MSDPWLDIIGIGEDGLSGLSEASRTALAAAETVFGGARHLALANVGDRGQPWPVPFDVAPVLACRGRRTAVLASGDPFWFGAGSALVERLDRHEWRAHAAPSTFSIAAARLGWRMEETICLGLHAAPFERLIPVLNADARIICLVRDGAAGVDLLKWLVDHGWGGSRVWLLSAIGGPRECITQTVASDFQGTPPAVPIAVAILAGGGAGLPRCSGLPDHLFQSDGQITKRPIRALALSALAPRPGQGLWDIGAGSGSISIEWALCGGHSSAIEQRADRAANIRANAEAFGVSHRVEAMVATAPDIFSRLPRPDAVFVGGGLTATLFDQLKQSIPEGTRVVAHAVTLESEALLSDLHVRYGGQLMRVEISTAEPLGRMRAWRANRPIVQWTVEL